MEIRGYCSCAVPKCDECGHQVLRIGQVGGDAVKDKVVEVVAGFLKDIELSETRRVFCRICNTYSYLGQETLNELRQHEDKVSMIRLMCEKVDDAEPLLKLKELLHTENPDRVSQYSEALLKLLPLLPHSIECTSPPGTPVPQFSEGVMVFFGTAHSLRISPAASPTGSNHSHQLAFPTEVNTEYY